MSEDLLERRKFFSLDIKFLVDRFGRFIWFKLVR